MRTEGETGDGGYLPALADVHPAQFPDDRPRKHHVYPGHRHRCMDSVPSYPGCYPAHQGDGSGNLILSIFKTMLFPALRFKNESLGRDFCVCRVVDEFVAAWGKLYGWRICKNI